MSKRGCLVCLIVLAGLKYSGQAQEKLSLSEGKLSAGYNSIYQKEKIYLHSDKNFYLAGEIIWFKVYCLDGSGHEPVNISKVAYVEILDRNNKPVQQARIALTDNGGAGSFYLPLSINSDHYVLRAYTAWMKNGGSKLFFEKVISIVNTTKRPVTTTTTNDAPSADARFFPEGGNLVEGIQTNIGFQVVDGMGRGLRARAVVVDNEGDTINQFSPNQFGLGHFSFKPAAGKTYRAIILLPGGRSIERSLPPAEKNGYVMNVERTGEKKLNVKINTRMETSVSTGEQLYLLLHNGRSTNYSEQINARYSNEVVIAVDDTRLIDGVNYLTLFNKDHVPVCERLVFKRPAPLPFMEIRTDKTAYSSRQEVDLTVIPKPEVDAVKANCSVSVYQIDSLQEMEGLNISTYLLLLSELAGPVESPDFYFSDQPGVNEAADELMLTHGWRRFRNAAMSKGHPSFKFLPEYRGHIISGRVMNNTTGNAVANADCYLTVPSTPFGFYLGRSDDTGVVRFDVRDYYGPGEIIAQVAQEKKENYRIDLHNPFSDEPAVTAVPRFALSASMEERLLSRSIAMQAQNIYLGDSLRHFMAPLLKDTLPFFGRAEFRYLLDDYKRFTTMEEVLREYVTSINVLLRNGRLNMSILDEAAEQAYHDNMLVLLDGVPLSDPHKIFTYDPLKVRKLDIVPRRYLLGTKYYSGIASFQTKEGRFSAFELDPSLIAVNYEGLQLQREFYSPQYNAGTLQNRVPDFRSTLFWTPDLATNMRDNSSIRFFTSDQKGKFIVVLQGITQTGKPVFGSTGFEVK